MVITPLHPTRVSVAMRQPIYRRPIRIMMPLASRIIVRTAIPPIPAGRRPLSRFIIITGYSRAPIRPFQGIVNYAITAITPQLQTLAMAAIQTTTMQPPIRLIYPPDIQRIANFVTHNLPGCLLRLIMTINISRFTAVATPGNGASARIAIPIRIISPSLIV